MEKQTKVPAPETAKKRIWATLSRIEDLSHVEKLIEKAAEGVDVRLILGDWDTFISAIDSFLYKHERAFKRAKILADLTHSLKRAIVAIAIVALMAMTAYVGISLYFGAVPFGMPIAWSIATIISFLVIATVLYRKTASYTQLQHDKAANAYMRAQTVREAIERNLKAMAISITHDLYIIDDRAWFIGGFWSTIDGPFEIDVKAAEKMFTKLWKKVNRPIFKLFDDIIKAKKRIWITAPKIEGEDADLLVRVASMASREVDVRVIAKNTKDLIDTAKFYSWLIEDAKSRLIKWTIEFLLLLILGAVFIITPLVYIALGKPIFPTFIALYLPSLLIYILWAKDKINIGYLNYVIDNIKEIEMEIGRPSLVVLDAKISSLKRNLNITKAPVTDKFFIIDDKAWINQGGELKEVDVKEVEGKFVEILNEYQPTADHKA